MIAWTTGQDEERLDVQGDVDDGTKSVAAHGIVTGVSRGSFLQEQEEDFCTLERMDARWKSNLQPRHGYYSQNTTPVPWGCMQHACLTREPRLEKHRKWAYARKRDPARHILVLEA